MFRVWGSGCRVQGSGFGVEGSGFGIEGLGLRVEGVGLDLVATGFRRSACHPERKARWFIELLGRARSSQKGIHGGCVGVDPRGEEVISIFCREPCPDNNAKG